MNGLKIRTLHGIIALLCLVFAPTVCPAQESALSFTARLGYEVGGTMPIGLPASIRGLNSFSPRANILVGGEAHFRLSRRWGVTASLLVENKGMRTDARVMGYSMEFRQGNDNLKGVFWGNVVTEVDQWLVSLPVMASLDVRRVRVKLGPYVSWLLKGNFSGYAYNGYLRKDNPTGPKVLIGDEGNSRGDYDFDDSLRRCQFGAAAEADWRFFERLGAFARLSWGLTGVFHSDFKTIEQTMYPVYGALGLFYAF